VIRLDGREIAAVFVGGALGAITRALVAELGSDDPSAWPWTTFAVNLVGAALLAYFATRHQERLPLSSYRRPLLGTGLCGGLTTFSTMQVEVIDMIEHGSYTLAVAYILASTLAGLLVVVLATGAVRRVGVR
jgi:CrcB protein